MLKFYSLLASFLAWVSLLYLIGVHRSIIFEGQLYCWSATIFPDNYKFIMQLAHLKNADLLCMCLVMDVL